MPDTLPLDRLSASWQTASTVEGVVGTDQVGAALAKRTTVEGERSEVETTMTYQEMQKAEAELNAALAPQKKQRGATRAQLEHRAKIRHLNALCVECGTPFGMHTTLMTYECAMNRS